MPRLPRNSDDESALRGDVYQTLAYSTHTKVRAELAKLGAVDPKAIVLCYPAPANASDVEDALGEASSALGAALAGRWADGTLKPRRYLDFDLRVILLGLPVPTDSAMGRLVEA